MHVGGGYNFAQIGGKGRHPTPAAARPIAATTIPEFFVGDRGRFQSTFAGTPNVLDTGRFLAHNYQPVPRRMGRQLRFVPHADRMDGHRGRPIRRPAGLLQRCLCPVRLLPDRRSRPATTSRWVPWTTTANRSASSSGIGHGRGICGWGAWEVAARWSYLDLQTNRIKAANYSRQLAATNRHHARST